MDIKKQNSFSALHERPLIFFLLLVFFHILVTIVLVMQKCPVQPSSQRILHQTMAKVLFQGAVGSVIRKEKKK